ncbi:hypothetical protein IGJ02_000145 [Enterococcus sp. DIV0724b]|uniref:YccF domain-containing protein n=1 Tax=Enterococcus sp. DIV0724b TaxID=2774694 RepID=UPI003D2FE5AE
MTILEWLFVSCFSAFLITFFVGIFSFFSFHVTNKKLNELNRKRPKNKRKKKQWLRAQSLLKKMKQARLKRGIMLLVLSVCFAGSGLYARYYQLTNLSAADSNIIVQSYFITEEVNKQLFGLQNGADIEKSKEKLMELSSLLASYGSSTPSNSLAKDGQQAMNRYYVQLRDFGTNIYSLTTEQLNDQETVSDYLEDLKQIKGSQKKIFKLFSVNESALKQKK